jgi:hypothetical protein
VIQTLEEREGLRTFHSRNSHSSAGVAGGTGRADGIARKQIHLYCSRWGGEVKESIESLIAKAVAKEPCEKRITGKTQSSRKKGTVPATDSLP